MKRILAILLAVAMLLSMGLVSATAEELVDGAKVATIVLDDAREHQGHREPVDRLEQIRHPGRFIKVTV